MLAKRKGWAVRILVGFHIASLALAACLAVIYNWPNPNAFAYYFTLRPAWMWFAPTLVPLVFGAFGLRRRWVAAGALAWLACFALSEEVISLVRLESGAARQDFERLRAARQRGEADGKNGVPLRIVTWNIAADPATLPDVASLLAALEPDLVFMQECSLRDGLPRIIAASPALGDLHLLTAGDNCILSRFEIASVDTAPPLIHGQVAAVTVPGLGTLELVNVHVPPTALVWLFLSSAEDVRTAMNRTSDVAALMASRPCGRTVLAGDFNTPGGSADLRAATRGLSDTFVAAGLGWGKTIPAAIPMSRIDMIYVPRGWRIVSARALGTTASDHRPVVADVVAKP